VPSPLKSAAETAGVAKETCAWPVATPLSPIAITGESTFRHLVNLTGASQQIPVSVASGDFNGHGRTTSAPPITAGQVYLPMYGTRTADGQTSNAVQIQIN